MFAIGFSRSAVDIDRHCIVGDAIGVDEGLVIFIIEWVLASGLWELSVY